MVSSECLDGHEMTNDRRRAARRVNSLLLERRPSQSRERIDQQAQILFKSPTKSETKIEPMDTTLGMRPRSLVEIQGNVEPIRMMAEAKALRGLWVGATNHVIEGMILVPGNERVTAFLIG